MAAVAGILARVHAPVTATIIMLKTKYLIVLALAATLLLATAFYFAELAVLIMTAALLAYVIDPLVDIGEARRIPRGLTAFVLVFGIAFLALGLIAPPLPTIVNELFKLARALPQVYDAEIAPYLATTFDVEMSWAWVVAQLPAEFMLLSSYGSGLGSLLTLSMHTLLFLMLLFLFLRDWDRIAAATRELLHELTPDEWNNEIDLLFTQIGQALSRLIRGQAEVSAILAVYYLIAFQTIGVLAVGDFVGVTGFLRDFFTPSVWMLLGALTGFLNLLPYIGVPVGGFITCLAALVSFQLTEIWVYPAIIGVVVVGANVDYKILSPRVIGRSVRVHELWVYVAVYIGYEVGGITGVILALPAMAVISEVVKRSLALWRVHRHEERSEALLLRKSA